MKYSRPVMRDFSSASSASRFFRRSSTRARNAAASPTRRPWPLVSTVSPLAISRVAVMRHLLRVHAKQFFAQERQFCAERLALFHSQAVLDLDEPPEGIEAAQHQGEVEGVRLALVLILLLEHRA